jgi:transposase
MKRKEPGAAVVDLAAIEADYRAGVMSLRTIAAKHGVSEAVVRKWARKAVDGEGTSAPWTRDLKPAVKARVAEILAQDRRKSAAHVRAAVRTPHARTEIVRRERTQTEEAEIVEVASRAVVQVVRDHRQSILAGQRTVSMLLRQLDDAAAHRIDFEEEIENETFGDRGGARRASMLRAVSLPAHAGVIRDLAVAMKYLVGLERQAFGLGVAEDPTPPSAPRALPTADAGVFDQIRAKARARIAAMNDVQNEEGSPYRTAPVIKKGVSGCCCT